MPLYKSKTPEKKENWKKIQVAKWTNWTWVTSIWKHMIQLNITVDIENIWTLSMSLVNDIVLMDITKDMRLSPICCVNQCCLHLNVPKLSDITTSSSKDRLPNIATGSIIPDHYSTFIWPIQTNPPESSWWQWSEFLQYFDRNGKLLTPLGY